MAAYDEIIYSPGEPFVNVYDKINDTFSALKDGAINTVLAGQGIGNSPEFVSTLWGDWIIVGNVGGAPSFATGFSQSSPTVNKLKFRKSVLLDQVQISGYFTKITTTLTDGSTALVFKLPEGYTAPVPHYCTGKAQGDNDQLLIQLLGDEVYVTNTTGNTININNSIYFQVILPLS